MFTVTRPSWADKAAGYGTLASDLSALLQGERDLIANAANMAALLWHGLPDLNWAGFYFLKASEDSMSSQRELVLGPFQGKPACVRIAIGRGACGTAAARRAPVVVPDVEAFAGHIACDSASRSELVVPLLAGDRLIGVLDLDSPLLARFDDEDQRGCERLAAILVEASDIERRV